MVLLQAQKLYYLLNNKDKSSIKPILSSFTNNNITKKKDFLTIYENRGNRGVAVFNQHVVNYYIN